MERLSDKIITSRNSVTSTVPTLTNSIIRGNEMAKESLPDKPLRFKKIKTPDDFWERVSVRGNDECWEWLGVVRPSGYGYASFKKERYAHRVAYLIANGEKASGLVCHTCDNRLCVNPSHLYNGNYTTNAQDREKRGRGRQHTQPPKSHCKRGHERTAETVTPSKACRKCLRLAGQRYRQNQHTRGFTYNRHTRRWQLYKHLREGINER